MTAAPLQARSPDRPVIRLHCPEEAAQALCRAMVQALAEAAGPAGPIIRQVSQGDTTPGRAGDIGVTLRLETGDPAGRWLSGHLEWQQGQADVQHGPQVRLDVLDRAALSAEQQARFARDLLRATPGIARALRDPP